MKIQLLLDNIARHVKLTPKARQDLIRSMEEKSLKKREFLVRENSVSKDCAFVMSGCLRSYSVDRNGFEHILQFAPSGWWITDMHSFVTQTPGKLNIEALENSEMLVLSRAGQEELFSRHASFERFFRIITEKSIAAGNYRLLDYMGLSARERYESFCRTYPTLMKSLPQKHIASYIGVTPEFLSKMKARMLKPEV